METRNPEYMTFVEDLFEKAAFIADVGYRLVDAGPGRCDSELRVLPRHLQQDGYVHAGVQATMADHTAGAAAGTLIARGEQLLTVEFKINLLRSGRGERLVCEARVLKPGRTLIVVESVVYGLEGEKRALTSKATVTLAALEGRASEGQPRYEVEDGVARLTLARPPRNPIDLPTARDLMRAAIRCDEDERVRAVLISAEGTAFSAGEGIGEFVGAGDELPGLLKEMTVYLHAAVSRLVVRSRPRRHASGAWSTGWWSTRSWRRSPPGWPRSWPGPYGIFRRREAAPPRELDGDSGDADGARSQGALRDRPDRRRQRRHEGLPGEASREILGPLTCSKNRRPPRTGRRDLWTGST